MPGNKLKKQAKIFTNCYLRAKQAKDRVNLWEKNKCKENDEIL